MSEETATKPEVTPVESVGEDVHGAILKQVEFYFSDQNLPKDKFLYQNTQKKDGWVPISVIAQFKRMQQFRPLEEIVNALRKSEELLEVSEDGESVRRKKPLVEPKKEDKINAFSRSVYAKGFPDETEGLQLEIEKFFNAYGPTNEVRLRRTEEKKFKNSVFVEFAKLEDAEKFLAVEPKPKYGDNELLTMSKKAYVDMKSAEHGFTQNANGKRKRFNAFNDKKHQNNNNNNNHNDRKRRNFNNRNDNRGAKRSRNDEKKEDGEKPAEQPVEAAAAEKPVEPAAAEKPVEAEAKE